MKIPSSVITIAIAALISMMSSLITFKCMSKPVNANISIESTSIDDSIRESEQHMREYMYVNISNVSSNMYCKLFDFEKRLVTQDETLSGFSDDFKKDFVDKLKIATVEAEERNKLITLAIVESCTAKQEKLARDIASLLETQKTQATEIDQLKNPEMNSSNIIAEIDAVNRKFIELDNKINAANGRADGFDARLFSFEKKLRDAKMMNQQRQKKK